MKGHSEIVKLLLVSGARDITNKVEHLYIQENLITFPVNYVDSYHYYLMNHCL